MKRVQKVLKCIYLVKKNYEKILKSIEFLQVKQTSNKNFLMFFQVTKYF